MRGWRLALLMAWRDTWRAKGRSVLVLVMIALPVLAVSAATVVIATAHVDDREGTDRRLGAADAMVTAERPAKQIRQLPRGEWGVPIAEDRIEPLTPTGIETALGRDVRVAKIARTYLQVIQGERAIDIGATEVDLRDPLATGLFDLESGTLPASRDEVVINHALAERGWAVGDRIALRGSDLSPTVVGVGRSAEHREPAAVGPIGAFGLDDEPLAESSWLVDAGGPVTWADLVALNDAGGLVVSRAVLADPADASLLADELSFGSGPNEMVAVIVLVVTMALLEVVLLAGPAFAVGARRQSRSLALLVASGGTPPQARRVVLASGVVLGGLAAAIGSLLGILLGIALLPAAQRLSSEWFGPLELRWDYLAAIAGFGLLSALLASVVPAWIASRQDVVAVLAGRRGDRPPTAKSPVLGVVLLLLGVAGSAYGAVNAGSASPGGEYLIAVSAVVAIFGMILVVPVVVGLVARLAGRFPLTMRYAARDAARHRTRTVPAIAAVAATVAGVVSLGIANASDEAENAASYTPSLGMGDARVAWYPDYNDLSETAPDWPRLLAVTQGALPDATVSQLQGVPESLPGGSNAYLEFFVERDTALLSVWGSRFGPAVLVSDDGLPDAVTEIAGADRERADAALRAGRPVVITDQEITGDPVRMRGGTWNHLTQDETQIKVRTIDAEVVALATEQASVTAILPSALVESVGLEPGPVGIHVTGAQVDEDQEKALDEQLSGVVPGADFYVERGYQRPDETVIILLVLFLLGAVLMLGGTLTATFLALSDARPDLATLSAIGASPRSRRSIAASYALVVGFVGAALGAAVGFIPGVAISRPLTSMGADVCTSSGGPTTCVSVGPFLDIPWLMVLALVVALPLLTAAIVGLSARSRLPLVARLD